MSLETWEETLKNHNGLLPFRHVRSGSCPRSPKWFPASVTICTCETHLESRLNSSILWFRLEPRSNSKIGGNDRIHSSILFLHLLWLDNPYTFLSLLSSGIGLIQGGLSAQSNLSQVPFSVLSLHHLVYDTARHFPHALCCHFSCLTPHHVCILLFHFTGCSKLPAEWT